MVVRIRDFHRLQNGGERGVVASRWYFSRVSGALTAAETPFLSPGCYSWQETFIRSPLHDSRVTRHRRRCEERSADPASVVSESKDGGMRRKRGTRRPDAETENWLRTLICFYLFVERASTNGWVNHRESASYVDDAATMPYLLNASLYRDRKRWWEKKKYIYIYIYICREMRRIYSFTRADNA